MRPVATYRGQPLVVLVLLLGGWVTARTIALEAESAGAAPALPTMIASTPVGPPPVASAQFAGTVRVTSPDEPTVPYAAPAPVPPPLRHHPYAVPVEPLRPALRSPALPAPVPVQVSAGHQLLWMAALSRMPLPSGLSPRPSDSAQVGGTATGLPRAQEPDRDSRWSADGWLLLRRGGAASHGGGLTPVTYGASQLGAVVRYRLAPQSPHRSAAYLRGSAALAGVREREVALGLSARPIAGLPVALAAEARINSQPGGTRLRPAAFAYTELPPVELPLGTRAELYGQAGYVGGNFASAFAEGQVRVDRRIVQLGRGELRAGGGAWGGAQKGASRLDLGPTATLAMPLGGTAGARLALDWRFRVAGNAAPASGPALTLSAGF